jgi:putative endonuclease
VYYVYVLKSNRDGKLYTGSTGSFRRRLTEHNDGNVQSTRHRAPFELVYYEASRCKIDALHRERYLKTSYGKRYLKNRLKGDRLI